ncbi:hypothetical protein HYPSUDRAFT_48494 [Hypholoma sublateritium FD-334 SS-4]|uniref:COP9 signalosome complex subunit 3 N-terminal helical repeats domain-containing protein n=1 Tax=Hypholoma sublateritium (strain FD-334 SS-4) TaxID=945553 RepID=A0A0D2NF45_HYPSF|nr:hypothetical protein HYPSUDRAFT_48494 [Hypholoma sublateritium FD-334 SS-4]
MSLPPPLSSAPPGPSQSHTQGYGQGHGQLPPPPHIDGLLAQIVSAPTLAALNTLLKGLSRDGAAAGGGGEAQLLGFFSDGRDPLDGGVLDVRVHGLGVLYILAARLSASFAQTPPPPWSTITEFCRFVDPKHAALAPERVTRIAKGIYRLAQTLGNLSLAVPPLYDLVTRLPPSAAHLTPIHPVFMLACLASRQLTPALAVLAHPLTDADTTLNPDLAYTDALAYHYTAGVALAALHRWPAAASALEIAVCTPCSGAGASGLGMALGLGGGMGGGMGGGGGALGMGGGHAATLTPTGAGTPAALQLEALKKLTLVQLIGTGAARALPRYAHPLLARLMRGGAYAALAAAYPDPARLKEVVEREQGVFERDRNLGLVKVALDRAPRWVLRKLTDTYATLHLADVARAAGLDGEDAARGLVLGMIESNEITAHISASGTVSFADPPPQYTRAQVDAALRAAQTQGALLALVDQEVGRGREFLSKAVKTSDSTWAPSADEEIFAGLGGGGGMWEETIYS